MHNEWEALIPFYIAHTLPDDQAVALAQHLATCELCQRALEEWRSIAAATEQAAKAWSFDLPPLAESVRERARMQRRTDTASDYDASHNAPTLQSLPIAPVAPAAPDPVLNRQRRNVPPPAAPTLRVMPPVQQQPQQSAARLPTTPQPRARQSRRLDLPLLRVAAAILVMVIGGAVLFSGARNFLSRGTDPTSEVAYLRTESATPDGISTGGTNPFLMTTPHVTLPGSTATTTPQEINPAATTPANSTPESGVTQAVTEDRSLQANLVPSEAALNSTIIACMATNQTANPLELLAGPGVNSDVIDQLNPGESLRVLVYTLEGWYQVIAPEGQNGNPPMWLYGGAVTLNGDCDRLVEPTPVPTPDGSCVATGTGVVTLYAGPGDDYPVLNTLDLQTRPPVALRSDDHWMQLRSVIAGVMGFGWSNQVTLDGNCGSLPYIAAGEFVTEPLPVPTNAISSSARPPVIELFTASSMTASPGDVITLTWQVTNADRSAIVMDHDENGTPDSRLDGLAASGSTGLTLEAAEASTVSFTLQAFAPGNQSDQPDAAATITINLVCPAVTLLFDTPTPCQQPAQFNGSVQDFEFGLIMIRTDSAAGLVLLDDGSVRQGTGSDPVTGTPPDGFYSPEEIFLPFYQAALGWADAPAQSGMIMAQRDSYDPVQSSRQYRVTLPNGRTIRLLQNSDGNFSGWNSVTP